MSSASCIGATQLGKLLNLDEARLGELANRAKLPSASVPARHDV